MSKPKRTKFASRSGLKLEAALETFGVDVRGKVCADFGSHAGGFVDVLLQHGAGKIFAVERGYGVLDYRLRRDERVVTMERTNAMHVELPERVDLVTIDVGWTKQHLILPAALKVLAPDGRIISLVKPHYEADPSDLRRGVLPTDKLPEVLDGVLKAIAPIGLSVINQTQSPIRGHGGNAEVFLHLVKAT